MHKYSEVLNVKISKKQKNTLDKIRARGFKVSDFVRSAIKEKIERDYNHLQEKPKEKKCPF